MPEAAAEKKMIEVPKIRIYAPGDLNRLMPFEYEGSIGTEITDFGKPFKDIHKDSITHRDEAALFNLYLLKELGEYQPSEELGSVLDYLFDNPGIGNVNDDACDYDSGDISMKKAKDTDRSVRWIVRPEGFELADGKWQAVISEDSEVYHILVPKTGHVALTVDGAYRPDTGTPFSTVDTRAEAERSWTSRGFSQKFAEKAVSRFWSRNEGQGTAAVVRWRFDAGGRRFNTGAGDGPDVMYSDVGSFVASRLPSGARQGVVTIDKKEYEKLVKDSMNLERMKGEFASFG